MTGNVTWRLNLFIIHVRHLCFSDINGDLRLQLSNTASLKEEIFNSDVSHWFALVFVFTFSIFCFLSFLSA